MLLYQGRIGGKTGGCQSREKEFGYDGTCRHLTPEQVVEKEAADQPSVLRFKVPEQEGKLAYHDEVLGTIERAYNDIEDFVIVRSNGKPLYMLCNVVDDIRDRITHIIRGQDHMSNTTRQVLLYQALDAPIPIFAHMPLTLDLQKRKISKRSHGELVSVQFYREKGFIPWALCNFLALLGWNPGTDQEIFSREELIETFTLDRISKVNSVFNHRKGDPKFFTDPKLISINEQYLRSMEISALAELVKQDFIQQDIWDKSYDGARREWFLTTLDLIRDRFHTVRDFATLGRAYFANDYTVEAKPLKKNILKHPGLKTWMPMLSERLAGLGTFDKESSEAATRELATELDIKPGILINGMRTVLTGQLAGPGMFDILIALGKNRVVERLQDIGHLYEE